MFLYLLDYQSCSKAQKKGENESWLATAGCRENEMNILFVEVQISNGKA